jgi:hypothetical protein
MGALVVVGRRPVALAHQVENLPNLNRRRVLAASR